jgi:predicted aldo/keto reductase-like oxidoreductase
MEQGRRNTNRRAFLKTVGAAGVGSILASMESATGLGKPKTIDANAPGKTQRPKLPQLPQRKLGKTALKIPCLTLGTATTNLIDNQIVLRKSLGWGVTCWDTATNYSGGNGEIGIGKYLSKTPEARKKLFIIGKPPDIRTPKPDVKDIEKHLQNSLKRMNTEYIDLYLGIHNILDPTQMTDELKQWAQSAKKRKLIRLFGFSTHKNMSQCLAVAAKLNWIDAVMTVYNFRLMQEAKMQASVEACHKAGIGLIAIKTLAAGPVARWAGHDVKVETEHDKKLVGHFTKQGFTEGQAKIKVVLEDKRFCSVCVGTENVALLRTNVAAALNRTKLTQKDKAVLTEYARATGSSYCAGCAYICDSVLPDAPYISDIMRYLMYYNSYGQQDRARKLFAQIPGKVRNKLLNMDYSIAEARCPQHLPISKLVAEATGKLA